jgi:hypothetical protein
MCAHLLYRKAHSFSVDLHHYQIRPKSILDQRTLLIPSLPIQNSLNTTCYTYSMNQVPGTSIAGGYKTLTSSASCIAIPTHFLETLAIALPILIITKPIIDDPTFFINLSKSIYNCLVKSYSLAIALYRISFTRNNTDMQAINIEMIDIPSTSTLALIHGLPKDTPTTQIADFLKTILSYHYKKHTNFSISHTNNTPNASVIQSNENLLAEHPLTA